MAETRKSDILRMTEAGVDEVFYGAAKKPRQLEYKAICNEKTKETLIGTYDTIGAIGPAQVTAEGDTVQFRKIMQAYETSIEVSKVTNGVMATIEALAGDLKGVVEKTFGEPLVKTMIVKKEKAVADVYNNGFATVGADGVNLFSDSHPLVNNALLLNDNLITGEMSVATIKAGKNRFNHIYDHSGELFDTAATHLLIHPDKLYLAIELLQSQLMALELSNTKNSLQEVQALKIITNRYLDYNVTTDVSAWFLLDKTLTEAGVILQNLAGTGMKIDKWYEPEDSSYRAVALEFYGTGCVAPGYGLVGSRGT